MLQSLLLAIMPMTATMEGLLAQMETDILTQNLGPITHAAISLAAACTAIAMISIGPRYVLSPQFNWAELYRPIVIFILVCEFSTLVLNPIRGISGVYTTKLAQTVGTSMDDFKKLYRERARELCHQEFGRDGDTWEVSEEQDNWFVRTSKKVGNRLLSRYFNINEKINYSAGMMVAGIMFFFLNMFSSVMVIIANIYLVIMALIGPFTFAISILPAFPGGLKLWAERYIQYTLWQPLIYIVLYIGTEILILGNQSSSWGGFWTWFFMMVAIFTVIKQVPGIASFIIESQGTESLANQLSGIGQDSMQKIESAKMIIR